MAASVTAAPAVAGPDGALRAFHDLGHDSEDFLGAVLDGLSRPQKRIPAKFFYDAEGSRLFDRICELEEYYPTRTETALLARHAGEIADLVGAGATLVEFGSGSSRKTRHLLDGFEAPAAYVPVDISREHLLASAGDLAAAYPALRVVPVCADYGRVLSLPSEAPAERLLGFFPGSTVGNFSLLEATGFLGRAAGLLGPAGAFLVGVDLQKDAARLHAAYNDSQGVTAAFNLNLLARMRRELEAEVDLDGFAHEARYNVARACIEMHLVSRRRQTLRIADRTFAFREGETIHTEDSHKYTLEGFQALARAAGWRPLRAWCDPERLFSLHYLAAS